MARLILDTGVLVAVFHQRWTSPPTDDIAIPVLAVTEFRLGALLDHDPVRARASAEFSRHVIERLPLIEYGPDVISDHADLLVTVRRAGRPRGAHDLIIAAMARATARTLVTTDRRAGFDELPGVDVRFVDP